MTYPFNLNFNRKDRLNFQRFQVYTEISHADKQYNKICTSKLSRYQNATRSD